MTDYPIFHRPPRPLFIRKPGGGTPALMLRATRSDGAFEYETLADAIAARIPTGITRILTRSRTSTLARSAAAYRYTASTPGHSLWFTDVGGRNWELDEPMPWLEQAGCVGDGSTNDLTAAQNLIDYCEEVGLRTIMMQSKSYKISGQLRTMKGVGFRSTGMANAETTATPGDVGAEFIYGGSGLSAGEAMILVKGDTNEFIHNFSLDGVNINGNNSAPVGIELASVRFLDIERLAVERCTSRGCYIHGGNAASAGGLGRIGLFTYDCGANVAASASDGLFISETDGDVGVTRITVDMAVTATNTGYGIVIGNCDAAAIGHVSHSNKASPNNEKAVLLKTATGTSRRSRKIDFIHISGQVTFEDGAGPFVFTAVNSEPSAMLVPTGDAAVHYRVYDRSTGGFFHTNNSFPLTRVPMVAGHNFHIPSGSGATIGVTGAEDLPCLLLPATGGTASAVFVNEAEMISRGKIEKVRIYCTSGAGTASPSGSKYVNVTIKVRSIRNGDGLSAGDLSYTGNVVLGDSANLANYIDVSLGGTLTVEHGDMFFVDITRNSDGGDITGDWPVFGVGPMFHSAGPTGDGVDFDKWYSPFAEEPATLP